MSYLDILARLEQGRDSHVTTATQAVSEKEPLSSVPQGVQLEKSRDPHGSILAVKIGGSVVGDFWLCLSDTEPFDPGDGLPIYRPSEIKALKGNGYAPHDLQAIHRAKVILEGRIVRAGT